MAYVPQVQTTFRILLLELDAHLTAGLTAVLPATCATVDIGRPADELASLLLLEHVEADLVFCLADCLHFPALVRAANHRTLPIVAVTRHPDVNGWLDALEAGAADYIAPPFEAKQLAWVILTNLRVPGKDRPRHLAPWA